MHLHDEIPIVILHVPEGDISENSGVIDQDMDSSERPDGSFNNLLPELHRIVVGNGLSSSLLYFINNDVCRLGVS